MSMDEDEERGRWLRTKKNTQPCVQRTSSSRRTFRRPRETPLARHRLATCRHPSASAIEIEDFLVDWLHTRPGAEHRGLSGPAQSQSSRECLVSRVDQALRRAVPDLESAGVDFALVGGLAVSVWVEPRFTRDVELAVVMPSDPAAEALTASLVRTGYQVIAQVEQEERHRLATVRLLPPGAKSEGLLVDLLFASSGVEPEIVEAAPLVEVLPDLRMRVARPEHLLALKVLASDYTVLKTTSTPSLSWRVSIVSRKRRRESSSV
jgi:hypothetical protein